MNLSVVVPVYNGERSLPLLVDRLQAVLEACAYRYELILVNDGSQDRSWDIICHFAGQYDCIRGINLMRNYGQHNALLCGIRIAQYDVIVTLDDDLQHPPEEIPKLVDRLNEGYDVVYGTPENERHGFFRNLASKMTKLALQNAMGSGIGRHASAFRAFRTRVREAFACYNSPFVCIDVLLSWGTNLFTAVPVQHDWRQVGSSNYTFGRLIKHAINMMTGFSTFPLQLASLIGFGFTLFGFGVLTYVVGRYLIEGGSVPGFPFLASIISIFSGAQLFALGIMGEYLGRIHFRSMDRPYSVIQNVVGFPARVEGAYYEHRADANLFVGNR